LQIKIVSDGTLAGTKVVDKDTGEMVHNVSKVVWKLSTDMPLATAVLTFGKVPVEVVGTKEDK
jgi:uncharacterized protein YrrD